MALIPLSKTDPSRLHPDTFDVRGWEVRSEADDDKVGSVDDILLDASGMPHLLDVNLGVFKKHVLVPLGQAWADASRRVVWIEGLAKQDIERMPDYSNDPDDLTPEFESRLAADYSAAAEGALRRERLPTTERLARLDSLDDFRIAKGSSDPRGWTVIGGDGAKLGKVSELIVDQEAQRVKYLAVDVDEEKVGLESVDRHVLMPVDYARLEHKGKKVIVDGLFARDLGDYPIYSGLPLAKGMEEQIGERFRAHAPSSEGWSDRSARRFFGGVRRRGGIEDPMDALAAPPAKGSAAMRAVDADPRRRPDERETVVRSEEGEEVRIRVSGGDIIIEKHPGGRTDNG
jgi:sporulation protein YlmC with PRC-barrel domain